MFREIDLSLACLERALLAVKTKRKNVEKRPQGAKALLSWQWVVCLCILFDREIYRAICGRMRGNPRLKVTRLKHKLKCFVVKFKLLLCQCE